MHIFSVCLLSKKRRVYSTLRKSNRRKRGKVTSYLCHEIASDNRMCPFMTAVNEPVPQEEVNQKGYALLDVQLIAEDVPCTFCTVWSRGRKGRLHEGSTRQSGFPPQEYLVYVRALCAAQIDIASVHQLDMYICAK